jgi:hypothetical protein
MLRSLFNYFIPKGLKLANNLEALRAMAGVKHRLLRTGGHAKVKSLMPDVVRSETQAESTNSSILFLLHLIFAAWL